MNLENRRLYHGNALQGSADLRTDTCLTSEPPPPECRAALANILPDVSARYYGCGLVAPQAVAGATVLDLGCGTGRDLSQLDGEQGGVVGIDATEEQLSVATAHQEWHRRSPNARLLCVALRAAVRVTTLPIFRCDQPLRHRSLTLRVRGL